MRKRGLVLLVVLVERLVVGGVVGVAEGSSGLRLGDGVLGRLLSVVASVGSPADSVPRLVEQRVDVLELHTSSLWHEEEDKDAAGQRNERVEQESAKVAPAGQHRVERSGGGVLHGKVDKGNDSDAESSDRASLFVTIANPRACCL